METVNEQRKHDAPLADALVPELKEMEPGDSIYIPNAPHMPFPPVGAVKVWHYGLATGRKYVCEYDHSGMRVWRTK